MLFPVVLRAPAGRIRAARPVRQLDLARGPDELPGLVEALAALF